MLLPSLAFLSYTPRKRFSSQHELIIASTTKLFEVMESCLTINIFNIHTAILEGPSANILQSAPPVEHWLPPMLARQDRAVVSSKNSYLQIQT